MRSANGWRAVSFRLTRYSDFLESVPVPQAEAFHPPPSTTTLSPLRALCARPGRGGHFVRAAVVGVIAGLVAVGFQWSLALAESLRGWLLDRLHREPHAALWGWAVLPAIAMVIGSFVGWLVLRFAPD